MPLNDQHRKMMAEVLREKELDIEKIVWILCEGRAILGEHEVRVTTPRVGTHITLKDPKIMVTLRINEPGKPPIEHPALRTMDPIIGGKVVFMPSAVCPYGFMNPEAQDMIKSLYVDFFLSTDPDLAREMQPLVQPATALDLSAMMGKG